MAKSTTRVHILAKELGVKSKAIVEKCQAEGLDIKNHMATISAGLAATIREWFSEGEHNTTVETAKRVDLEKVRVKKKKKAAEKAAAEKAEQEAGEAQAVQTETDESADTPAPEVAEEMPETPAESAQEAQKTETETAVAAQVEETPSAAAEAEGEPAAEKEEKLETQEKKTHKPARPQGPVYVRKEPPKPEEVKPAGPRLDKPKPAALSGPNVIRVEKIEPHETRAPRKSRPPSRPKFDTPISEPLLASIDIGQKGAGGKKGKRGKSRKDDFEKLEDAPRGKKKMLEKDIEERRARLAAARGESLKARPTRKIETRQKAEEKVVERPEKATVSEPVTVKDLSAAIAVKTGDIIKKLMEQGVMATANQVITNDVAELISLDFGTELTIERKHSMFEQIEKEFDEREKTELVRRPPVVTMLGHVDHGKTSLLDRIRQSDVAGGEAGGITQHIGAYQVEINGKKVTFLDTPGHEAFTSMRARGANMTDIVVLVIAADDGVMPQTIEAINHAKAADVEIIVALNKIDIPGVDINRIYGQLAEHDLTPSEWSGNTEIVKTSATTGQGIEDLIEHLDYIAELKDYKADSTLPATGWVVEAQMTTSRGAVATVLIKEGVLKKGDTVLAGAGHGRIRTLRDSRGRTIRKATSSDPVEISGLSDVPEAGDRFFCISDANKAKAAAEEKQMLSREETLAKQTQISLDNLFSHIEAGNIKELNLIIRGDVQGSVDVLVKYLSELSTEEVKVKIVQAAVGGITEGDVVLAEASGAIIIGFNAVPEDRVKQLADSKGIDIRLYSVIYNITKDVKDAMSGLLEPEIKEETTGSVEVRNTFKISGVGTIAGCYVKSGKVTNKSKLRLIRNNIVVKDNCKIDSLKHFKDDVKEVKAGFECGIKLVGFDDIKIDDKFEAYEVIEVARTVD